MNEAREEKEDKRLAELRLQLDQKRERTSAILDANHIAEATISKVLKGIDDLVR